jgi:hypothetical protein
VELKDRFLLVPAINRLCLFFFDTLKVELDALNPLVFPSFTPWDREEGCTPRLPLIQWNKWRIHGSGRLIYTGGLG